jgi:hypothetical protein
MREVDERSWRVIVVGLAEVSMKVGHSSRPFRVSISYNQ